MKRFALALLVSLLPRDRYRPDERRRAGSRGWRQQHERAIVDEFVALLSIPEHRARPRQHPAQRGSHRGDDGEARRRAETGVGSRRESGRVRRNQHARRDAHDRLLRALRRAAAGSERMGHAAVRARRCGIGSWRRTGSVVPLPRRGHRSIRNRVCTRGPPADDKAPIIAMMAALDAIRAAGMQTKSNIKFAFEGEEEAGSVNLEKDSRGQQSDVFRRHVADVRWAGPPDAASVDLSSARAASPRSISQFTGRAASCTAATTATGRPIPR